MQMPPNRKLIAVIDDDASVRKALDRQITAAGYRCHSFASAEQFLSVAATLSAPPSWSRTFIWAA